MENPDAIYAAFKDELEKISGTGRSRSARISIKPMNIASKTGLAARGVGKFFRKFGGVNPQHVGGALVSGVALGLYGERKLKQMKQDFQIRRQMRQQGM